MSKLLLQRAALNTIAASGKNVKIDATAGWQVICEDNTTNPAVQVLPPFKTGTLVSLVTIDPAAEAVRKWRIGGTDVEVIEASRRYKIELDRPFTTYESDTRRSYRNYAYTAPAALTGTAATDRLNAYTALVNTINADAKAYATAYGMSKIVFTASGANTHMVVNQYVFFGSNWGARAWSAQLAYDYTSTSWSGPITIYVYNEVGTWVEGTAIKAAGVNLDQNTAVSTASTVRTAYQGIMIVDDSGYKNDKNYSQTREMSIVRTPYDTDKGFQTAHATLHIAGTYAQGIGSDLAAKVAAYTRDKRDVIDGNLELDLVYGSFDTTKTYTEFIITYEVQTEPDGSNGATDSLQVEMHLYAVTPDSNLADLKTELAKLT